MNLEEQVAAVVGHSQKIENPKVTALLKDWREAKKTFIELFNGELIYQYPTLFSFTLGEQEKVERVNHFIQVVDEEYNLSELSLFLEAQKESFFENKVTTDYEYLNAEGKWVEVPIGMKLIKAFKFFISDKVLLHRIQDEASMIIQENKLTGYLCLSVHPLDYLSSSENQCNWRSCHALNGDYRAGNLSYMCDKSTVICYIRGEEEVKLPNFPDSVFWNNKKWRMLLHFSEDKNLVFAARPYPFALPNILETIQAVLSEAFKDNVWRMSRWTDYHTMGGTDSQGNDVDVKYHIAINSTLYPIRRVVKDKSKLHFNDVLRSSVYTPFYMTKAFVDVKKPLVEIGSDPKCCQCGEHSIEYCDVMRCDTCELMYGSEDTDGFTWCDMCHRRLYRCDLQLMLIDSDTLEIGFVCPKCCSELSKRCLKCGENVQTSLLKQGLCPNCRKGDN